jgi:hypothetical protein
MSPALDGGASGRPRDVYCSDLDARLSGRGEHDPLVLVRERLARLLDMLQADPPTINKIQTLQELGFLSEHSLSEGMTAFHESIRSAIDEAMTSGWE